MQPCLFIAALWSPAGKELATWLSCMLCLLCFVSFPCGVLGQVSYLIVSIPDLCLLTYLFSVCLVCSALEYVQQMLKTDVF